jgi:16S rRNA (cytosine1402-N4)-methyltransferase
LREYGEEPKARAIAQKIVESRPIRTTDQLAAIAKQAWPGHSKVHPATRTFQALRILVNDELDQLEQSLPLWLDLLSDGGRLVIISFHSLEDRIVKKFFAEHGGGGYDAELSILTKKPILPSHHEIVSNPRARSAKLRAAAKIKK